MSAPGSGSKTEHAELAKGFEMFHHGFGSDRGGNCPRSRYYDQGRFGRLFPSLRPFLADDEKLAKLGNAGGLMDGPPNAPDNPAKLPAGFTFLGQFIDHDITFDPTSSLERQADPESVSNFRTPLLELDSVYGAGPGASPHLYQMRDPDKLLIGLDSAGQPNDLPRNPEGRALLGDPRNDENIIVSQLHLAFLKFHNAMVDKVRAESVDPAHVFEEAQQQVRWHYQWIVLHEFLDKTVGQEMRKGVLKDDGTIGRKFFDWRHEPFIPVEFSVAAYRFGHSQVRPFYAVSSEFRGPIFSNDRTKPGIDGNAPEDLSGGRKLLATRVIQWHRFFDVGGIANELQQGKAIDTKISSALLSLPSVVVSSGPISLATRNLQRGVTFGLPSGQDVARAMGETVLTEEELGPEVAKVGLGKRTPLWFYILKEAELFGKPGLKGATLGPVGGRIVAEVLVGLVEGDRFSYLRANRSWKPCLGKGGDFTMADLLRFAGVVTGSKPMAC